MNFVKKINNEMYVKKKHSDIDYVDDLPFSRFSLLSVLAPAFSGADSTSFSDEKKKYFKWSQMYKVYKLHIDKKSFVDTLLMQLK